MKLIKIIILLFISFNTTLVANSNDDLQNLLSEGGKLIFIRHAYAPGSGDPSNFNISDCNTQRNLNEVGINQSINIGNFFLKNNIKIDKILSSEWCRCKQTSEHAFKTFETKSFLNSFFSQKFENNKTKQIKELKEFIQNWDSKANLVLVTHYVLISEILNYYPSSGEIIVTDKKFNILSKLKIKY